MSVKAKNTSAGYSDQGPVRANNEDAFVVDPDLNLYAVADGVGGHAAGEIASKLAIEAAVASVRAWRAEPKDVDIEDAARLAVEAACHAVHSRATGRDGERGMATTLSLVLVDADAAAMAHVGDSRVYLVRDDVVSQLSPDHTMAAELARMGSISAAQVAEHPYRHVLVRSLGSQTSVMADTLQFELHRGDRLVLATDGLNPVVESAGDFQRFFEGGKTPTPRELAQAAIEAGTQDNVTVIVVDHGSRSARSSPSEAVQLAMAPMFTNLSPAGLLTLIRAGNLHRLAAGEVLVAKGSDEDRMVTVLDGALTLSDPENSDPQTESLSVGAFETIGMSMVLTPGSAPYELRAAQECLVFTLTESAFGRIVETRRNLGAALLRRMAQAQARALNEAPDPLTRLRGY